MKTDEQETKPSNKPNHRNQYSPQYKQQALGARKMERCPERGQGFRHFPSDTL